LGWDGTAKSGAKRLTEQTELSLGIPRGLNGVKHVNEIVGPLLGFWGTY